VSTDASVAMAAFLQYIAEQLIHGAVENALKEGVETRVKSSHVQATLSNNNWMRSMIKGRVLGAAPMTRQGEDDN